MKSNGIIHVSRRSRKLRFRNFNKRGSQGCPGLYHRGFILRGHTLVCGDGKLRALFEIKNDFFKVMSNARHEARTVLRRLELGKIDGLDNCGNRFFAKINSEEERSYSFVDTIAKLRGEPSLKTRTGLGMSNARPSLTEHFFDLILTGQTPQNSDLAQIAADWLDEFIKENGL